MIIQFKLNDTKDKIEYVAADTEGNPVDLTGSSVRFIMSRRATGEVVLTDPATITDPINGKIEYSVSELTTIEAGDFRAEFIVDFPDSTQKTFPTIGYLSISIQASLERWKTGKIAERIVIELSAIDQYKTDITAEVNTFKNDVTAEVETFKTHVNTTMDDYQANTNQDVASYKNDIDNTIDTFQIEVEKIEPKMQEASAAIQTAQDSAANADRAAEEADLSRSETITATVNAENARVAAEQATAEANTQAEYAKAQGDNTKAVAEELKTKWLVPVADFAAIATTYPEPSEGDTVQTQHDSKIYRYQSGSWLYTQKHTDTVATDLQAKFAKANRSTKVLPYGTSIIDTDTPSPIDLEIEGETLISLGQSNLEIGKKYVLADKKTRIKTYKDTHEGVKKFEVPNTLVTTADYAGKVADSTVVNPHRFRGARGTSLQSVNLYTTADNTQAHIDAIKTLNGVVSSAWSSTGSGELAQHLFSINIIEQIERNYGIIPKETLADKVQWAKDNLAKITANWHGFGSGPSGNKANFAEWYDNSWNTPSVHTNGTVTKLVRSNTLLHLVIDSNGFVHYLAHADPSDGVTASTINTDFFNTDIELKANTDIITKPQITSIADFEGKVSASLVENPHKFQSQANASLISPTGTLLEISDPDKIYKLDGIIRTSSNNGNGNVMQHHFSFDLIAQVERTHGRIPGADTAAKVQWLKDNLSKIVANWHGFGSGPSGNKATLCMWRANTNDWGSGPSHISNSITKLTISNLYHPREVKDVIDNNGLVHFLAYADASDGVTASTINTDFVNLEIELKPMAQLFDPITPLYEVDATEYGKILADWTESDVLTRYPRVQGMKHVQNPIVTVEGENLLPSNDENWYQGSVSTTNGSPNNIANRISGEFVSVVPNQQYSIVVKSGYDAYVYEFEQINGSSIGSQNWSNSKVFTTSTKTNYVRISVRKTDETNILPSEISNVQPMFTLGSEAKPFVPRNPSHLYAETKLGRIGTKKDVLFQDNGEWKVREEVVKDVVLDGSLDWIFKNNYTKHKRFDVTVSGAEVNLFPVGIKYNGLQLYRKGLLADMADISYTVGSYVALSVSNTDTGFGETYTPTTNDIKRYFNGWKYTDGTTWNSVTGNGQTATAQEALDTKPTDYTPYKLSYVRATAQVKPVNVEGAISVQGKAQANVGSGVIVREKVVPYLSGGSYFINADNPNVEQKTKHATNKIMKVDRNNGPDYNWELKNYSTPKTNGNGFAQISESYYDPAAEYTVTYLVLNRHLFTNNPKDIRATVEQSIPSSLSQTVAKQSDLETKVSVLDRMAYDMLLRIKALEGAQ
ncbi:BppU family phage baseplate upper protein [Sutcliffiella halmapala]